MTFGSKIQKESHLKLWIINEKGKLFDTAEMYPTYPKKETQGDSERIGNWINKKKIEANCNWNKSLFWALKGIGATDLNGLGKGERILSSIKN